MDCMLPQMPCALAAELCEVAFPLLINALVMSFSCCGIAIYGSMPNSSRDITTAPEPAPNHHLRPCTSVSPPRATHMVLADKPPWRSGLIFGKTRLPHAVRWLSPGCHHSMVPEISFCIGIPLLSSVAARAILSPSRPPHCHPGISTAEALI